MVCVSPYGGEEGSFGEQLEKLNRHQNLDGNGIQGYNSSTMYKKRMGRGVLLRRTLEFVCSPQEAQLCSRQVSPVHASPEGL